MIIYSHLHLQYHKNHWVVSSTTFTFYMGPITPLVTGSGAHFVGNAGLYLAKHTIFHHSKFFPGNVRRSQISLLRFATLFKGSPPQNNRDFPGLIWPGLKNQVTLWVCWQITQTPLKLLAERTNVTNACRWVVKTQPKRNTSWWLNQPIWKILVKMGIFPK